jgi:hypothetical protein
MDRFRQCLFLSPVLDMERPHPENDAHAGVHGKRASGKKGDPDDFGERRSVGLLRLCPGSTRLAVGHPTAILSADHDELIDADILRILQTVSAAARPLRENAEHWFHTPEQIINAFFRCGSTSHP